MAGRMRGIRFSAIVVWSLTTLCSAGLSALLAACGSSAPSQAKAVAHASAVPTGYTEFRDAARGYSLAVPSSWIQVNVQSASAAATFAQLLKQDPQLSQVLGNNLSTLLKDNVSLIAVGPSAMSANMVVEPGSGTLTAAQLGTLYSDVLQPAYARAGITVLSHQKASLDAFAALRISITITFGKVVLPETQFIAAVHGNEYVLTVARATPALTNKIAGTVEFL